MEFVGGLSIFNKFAPVIFVSGWVSEVLESGFGIGIEKKVIQVKNVWVGQDRSKGADDSHKNLGVYELGWRCLRVLLNSSR